MEAHLKQVTIRTDGNRAAGRMRALHGVTNYAPLTGVRVAPLELLGRMQELAVPYSSFHDASLENPGMNLIDVSRVFPIFAADATDPASYTFAETDEYLARVVTAGVKIIYRLGESIELTTKSFRTRPPTDMEKWAEICIHIAMHYNDGWANGFHYGIEYWPVWEEPNNPNLWGGEFSEYLRLYEIVSTRFKARFPHLKIGGPQTTTLGTRYFDTFIATCREKALPLDFAAFTAYYRDPATLLKDCWTYRKKLDDNGFGRAEFNICEWHYSPIWEAFGDAARRQQEYAEVTGVNGAVFTSAVLSGLQDTPVDLACYYTTCMSWWGLFTEERLPYKTYYAFKAYTELASCVRRIAVETEPCAGVYVLAGETASGDLRLLVSCFRSGPLELLIDATDLDWSSSSVRVLDEERNLDELPPAGVVRTGKRLVIRKANSGSAAYLLELRKKGSTAS